MSDNNIYKDEERQHYQPRIDFKESPNNLLIKELLPVDKRTGEVVNVVLTVASAKPQVNEYHNKSGKSTKQQYVLYFVEKYTYIIGNKPLIWSLPLPLNPTNAKKVRDAIQSQDINKIVGKKVELYFDKDVTIGKEVVGGIRIKKIFDNQEKNYISQEELQELETLLTNANFTQEDFCLKAKIESLCNLPQERFASAKTFVENKIKEQNNAE
jgi:hypothetical protein